MSINVRSGAEPDELEEPYVSLRRSTKIHASFAINDLDISGRSERGHPAEDGLLTDDLLEILGGRAQRPRRTRECPPALTALVGTTSLPSVVMEIGWDVVGSETVLTGAGVVILHFTGSDAVEVLHGWADASSAPVWYSDPWMPAPVMSAIAQSDGAEACIGTFGRMLVVGVRVDGDVSWATIRHSTDAQAATAVGRLDGISECDWVAAVTWPSEVQLTSIINGTPRGIGIVPKIVTSSVVPSRTIVATKVLQAWQPTATVMTPPSISLPNPLVEALAAAFPSGGWTSISVGAAVSQEVELRSGVLDSFAIELAPGQHSALRTDAVTGEQLHVAHIDGEGHAVSEVLDCQYCTQLCCSACVDGPRMCGCCGMLACATCIGEVDGQHLCEACRSLVRPTRSGARQHGRLLSTKNIMIGTDPVHTVVIERTNLGWTLAEPGGRKQVDKALESYLDRCYANVELR